MAVTVTRVTLLNQTTVERTCALVRTDLGLRMNAGVNR